MAEDNPTIGALHKAKLVSEEQLLAAVDAYEVDPTLTRLIVGPRTVIDPAAAIQASAHATKMLKANVRQESKRDAVGSAFLLAKAMGE